MLFPLIASHRGGALLWPENSRLAFENTAALPVDFVEFDVQRTADGVLAVFHDATVERVLAGEGAVRDLTWAQISAMPYRAGPTAHVLTLQETLAIFAPTRVALRLEIKPGVGLAPYEGIEAEVVAELTAAGLRARTLITSFRRDILMAVRNLGGAGLGLGWLIADPVAHLVADDAALWRLALEAGATQAALRIALLTPQRVAGAAAAGVSLGAFAVHTQAEIAHAVACGAYAFTSDRPDLALAARAAA